MADQNAPEKTLAINNLRPLLEESSSRRSTDFTGAMYRVLLVQGIGSGMRSRVS